MVTSNRGAYAVRKIDFQFALGKGSFGEDGSTTLSVSGLRSQVSILHAQVPDTGPTAIARIYGLTLTQMNALSKAGLFWDTRKNEMVISAGDDADGMVTVFKGIVQEAYPDFSQMPNTSFYINASPGPLAQLKPIAPLSYPGSVDTSTVLGSMAKSAGWTLEDGGVAVKLASSYFPGTAWDQIVRVVKASNIYATIDAVGSTLAIWPKTGSRKLPVVTISAGTGMIGYPQFSTAQVTVRSQFGPQVAQLTRGPGQRIKISSTLDAANGEFVASEITLNLSSQTPRGPWEMIVTAYPPIFGQSGG